MLTIDSVVRLLDRAKNWDSPGDREVIVGLRVETSDGERQDLESGYLTRLNG